MKTLDAGQAETNKLIEKVEKRVNKEYSQATKDMQKKLNNYLKSFESKDKAMQKQLADGLITDKQYKDWRYGQIMVGKRWQEQLDVLSKDLENSRQIAMNIVSGELPSAYAIGHNYGTYLVESGTSLNTSYTLYDRDTVSKLLKDRPKLLPDPTKGSKTQKALQEKRIQRWSKAKMTSAVAQGVLQGEAIPKIASRLRNVTDMSYRASIRNARTMLTSSENLGRQASFERAHDMGIEMEKQWLATLDDRTRDSHALMDGERVPLDENFSNGLEYPADPSGEPEEIYNCFAGETKIASDSNVVRSYKHKYDGKIISIKTAGGVQFSCTPNHPILTPGGWVAAELLNNGDNILVTHGENNVFSRVNPYIDHRFPRIDAIHEFGKKTRGQRTCGLSVNFHGDVSTADVEVVTHKRFLWDGIDACRRNCINKFLLKLSNKTISRFGSLVEHFWSVCMTSFSLISRKCKSLPFFKCSMSHSCKHGFGTIANGDVVLTEYSINDLPADTVIDGELLNRLSCKVFIDTIVNVDVSALSTHVYNLQTENGYYFVNSIIPQDAEKNSGIFAIAKNCRCTMVTAIKDFEKAITDFDLSENEKLGDMTYDEWKDSHMHGSSNNDGG